MAKLTVRFVGALGVACACAAVSGDDEAALNQEMAERSLAGDPKTDRALLMSARIV